jgi:single-strand DNA-binding protein
MAVRSLNKVMLIGHLGKDPEVRYTANGLAVANFSLATNESWKDQDGNVQERTEWHNIVMWSKLAEIAGEWLKKGKQVYLEGRLQTRSYDDKNGVKRYVTEIVATDMIMLGGPGGSGSGSGDQSGKETPATAGSGVGASTGKDDDLPF